MKTAQQLASEMNTHAYRIDVANGRKSTPAQPTIHGLMVAMASRMVALEQEVERLDSELKAATQ